MTSRRTGMVAYVAAGLSWGTAFMFMQQATEVVSPSQTTLLRVVFGAIPVVAFAAWGGHVRLRHLRHLHHFLVMSILAGAFYFYAFAAGTQVLDTSVAGALAGAIPLFATLAAAVLLPDESLNRGRLLGLAAGLAGVVLLAEPWHAGDIDPVGFAWMLIGCLSVGLSFPYARRFITPTGVHPAAATAYQLVLAALILLIVTDLDGITDIADDPRILAGTVLGLGLAATGIAFVLMYVMVDGLGASTASTVSYLPPAIAMVIGVVALGEPFRVAGVAGLLLIGLGAVITHRYGTPRSATRLTPPRAAPKVCRSLR